MKQQFKGFGMVEALVVIVVLVLVGAVGYLTVRRAHQATVSNIPTTAEQAKTAATPNAPPVNNTSDLDSASKALDATNVDAASSDSIQLDSQLSNF